MGHKIGGKKVNPFVISGLIVIIYLISSLVPYLRGPIYVADKAVARVFWVTNSVIVFGFLVFYTNILIKMIIHSEDTLINMALMDNLTNLHNRHYMMTHLEKAEDTNSKAYVAMIDIDGFKKINDVYGHNAGDMVLEKLARVMESNCEEFSICRWGGEEFLILMTEEGLKISDDYIVERMDKLRRNVENTEFIYEDKKIKVTVTIGVAEKSEGSSIERWVDAADDKLYQGKNSGKNKVVM
jgi:diguanylate cyclase (GGDEF)-like protein